MAEPFAKATPKVVRDRILTCFRESCGRSAHACGYNQITHGLYCLKCAREISRYNSQIGEICLFPFLAVLEKIASSGAYRPGRILIRESPEEWAELRELA